jgi:hypothetical protein
MIGVIIGAGIAAASLLGRAVVRHGGFKNAIRAAYEKIDLEGPESPNKQKQQGKNPFSGPLPGSLTRKEAILILNMSEREAKDPKTIREKHRQLMMKNHPDQGGSPYLALKINEAKDTLLQELGHSK